jgi:Tetratricopeptide repeat
LTAQQEPPDTPRLYFQDIRVENGVGIGVIGADMHVFGDSIPLYLLENWHDSPDPDPQWLRALPSRLLNARFGVVEFTGRQEELAALHAWRETGPRLAVRWLHAPGGTGKTRLAARFAAESAARRWKVVTATHAPGTLLPEMTAQDLRPDGFEGLLLVVDYADRWPRTHLMLLLSNRLLRRSEIRTRILLIARDADDWPATRAELARQYADTSSQLLAPLPDDVEQRTEMFAAARDGFARHYGVRDAHGIGPPTPLDRPDFALTLAVHISALVAVDAHVEGSRAPSDLSGLTVYLLDREQDHWYRLHGDGTHELNPSERVFKTPPGVMNRLVYTASLTGAIARPVGETVVGSLRLETGRDAAGTLADHAFCYPPGGPEEVLEPLYPDRLAEDFLALTVPGHPADYPPQPWASSTTDTLLARRDGAPALWTPRALAFLLAAAERWPHLGSEYLWPLLRTDPQLAVDAGSAALGSLARVPTAPIDVLEQVEARFPRYRQPDLDPGIAAVARRLAVHRIAAAAADAEQQISLRFGLAQRLADAGLWEEALDHALAGTVQARELAEADPRAHEDRHAAALSGVSGYLLETGYRQEALSAAAEAADIWRRRMQDDPETYAPLLAQTLGNLAVALAGTGRPADGLEVAQEALAVRRRVAQRDPESGDRWVAESLHNVASGLAELGRWPQAVARAEESIAIYRRLAEKDPARFGPDVAGGLAALVDRLDEVGRYADALAAAEESVTAYQLLATVNQAAYERDLANATGGLAGALSRFGRHEDALEAQQRAAAIHRRLAAADPAAREPDLARALYNLALYQSRLRRWDDALESARESVLIWRRLATGDPAAYRHRLAHALSGLAVQLADARRPDEAVEAGRESVALLRELVAADPDRHRLKLATALTNLGGHLASLGRPDLGLPAGVEAVAILRELAARYPAAHEPDLAIALGKLGTRHAQLRDPEGSAAAYEEAAGILRRLAHKDPEVFEPELASLLRALSPALDRLRRHAEATAVERESVTVLRALTARDRAAFEPMLAGALSDLAASLTTSGDARDGARLAEEAVALLVPLAARDPGAHGQTLAIARRVLVLAKAKGAWAGLRGR